jgi:hypothetical protein
MKIITNISLLILSLTSTLVFASPESEPPEGVKQFFDSLNEASKKLRDAANLTDLGVVTLKYNEKGREELPFTPYQKNSEIEYTSPPNVWIERGKVADVAYESYFGDGWDPIKLINRKSPKLFLSENYRWPKTFFGMKSFNFSEAKSIWTVGCSNDRGPTCEMTKGTIHLSIIEGDEGDSQIIYLQESDIEKIHESGKALYINEYSSERPMSIQIDKRGAVKFSYKYEDFGKYIQQVPKIINELKTGKFVTTKYDYQIDEQYKTYEVVTDLYGFNEAYDYMLWSFEQLKSNSK